MLPLAPGANGQPPSPPTALSTADVVYMLHGMGIETGVDLDHLIEVGRMAEQIIGRTLPSELIHANSLDAFRREGAR